MEIQKIKEILNNVVLLRWTKKFSADNLLENNKMAKEKYKVKTTEDSISILDATSTKLLVTNAEFNGEEIVRFNLKQMQSVLDVVGSDGELVIPKDTEMNEMIAEVGNNIEIICPLPKSDKKKK